MNEPSQILHLHQETLTPGTDQQGMAAVPPSPVPPATSLPEPTPDQPSTSPPPKTARTRYRAKGKIASLTKAQRDLINQTLLDGGTSTVVIQLMAKQGVSLNAENVSNWLRSGFEDWLEERACLDLIGAKSDFSADLVATPQCSKIHEASLRIAAAQMLTQLMRFAAETDPPGAQAQADKLPRLVNALSRLTREAFVFQKYHDATVKAAAAELPRKDLNREFEDTEYDLVTQRMDDFFRKPRRRRSPDGQQPLPPNTADLASPQPQTQPPTVPASGTGTLPAGAEPDSHPVH